MSSLLRRVRGVDLDLFCLADPQVFDDPVRHRSRTGLVDYEVADLPGGCRRVVEREWVHLMPERWSGPSQGWKVHVSALPAHAAQVLGIVARYCLPRGIAFKHLRSEAVLLTTNAKYAARSSSGKFVAVYPRDEGELFEILDALDPELSGLPGPYVLSDLRWNAGPLYVRWGGFATRHCVDAAGIQHLAVENPAGLLVPDERVPYFSVPDWVRVPARLAALQEGGADLLAACGFRFESALHFSNGGGVYRGARTADGSAVVLKEARPHAGLDSELRDAVTRLEHEHAAYVALGRLAGVPALIDHFELWEHRYLVTSHVEGQSLQRWMAAHHPSLRADPTPADHATYAAAALDLVRQTAAVLASIHDTGWSHGDLHPGNVIVGDDGSVHLIDLEQAKAESDPRTTGLGCPGFVRRDKAPQAPLTQADDVYALGVLALWVFAPLVVVADLDPSKPAAIAPAVRRRFGLPAWWDELVAGTYGWDVVLGRAERPAVPAVTVAAFEAGIEASATPERDDRLFPADVVQVLDQGVDFATGAAGILWETSRSGRPVDPEHLDWLLDRRRRPTGPGFCDGAAGVATALITLGEVGPGLDLLHEAADAVACSPDLSVSSGRAGVGLLLLAHADLVPGAVDLALTLADGIDGLRPTSAATPSGVAAGFVDGWAGVACFLARLAGAARQPELATLAVDCLRRDLDSCSRGPDGALLVDERGKLFPYLAFGSAGIALAAAELTELGHQALSTDEVAALVRGLAPELVLEPGLFEGRAGLLWVLRRVGESGLVDTAALVRRHLEALPLQTVTTGTRSMVLGRNLRRTSADLATGTAGVLSVVRALESGTCVLPVLPVVGARDLVGSGRP